MTTRILAGGLRALLLLLLACALHASAQSAKSLKKVTLAVGGVSVLNAAYPWLMMPLALGYWRDEGYDVEVVATPGSLQTVQQLAAGSIALSQMSAGALIQANVMNNLPIRAISVNNVLDWAVGVQADGPVAKVADLKGKNIGIVSLASGGLPMLKALLRAGGLDPDKDVTIVAVGTGAPALEALRANRVQGLMFWHTALVGFENAGGRLRYLSDPAWETFADFSLATTQRIIDSDPAMVEAIARGVAKASLFTATNPQCARQLHWKRFPQSKPTGADEATLARNDDRLVAAVVGSMDKARRLDGGQAWGRVDAAGFQRMQDFLFDNKVIDRKVAPETFVIRTPGFAERVDRYDHEAVIRQAKACAIS
jgi:NitT/TauT family transport system substrate-binding protein